MLIIKRISPIFIALLLLLACNSNLNNKSTGSLNEPESQVPAKRIIGKYVYLDANNTLHVKKNCVALLMGMEDCSGCLGVKHIRIYDLPMYRNAYFCSQCIDDSIFECLEDSIESYQIFVADSIAL